MLATPIVEILRLGGTTFAILRLVCGAVWLISHWCEEKFARERTNVPDAVGFAFAMEA
jgi:hypothetical protein